MSFCSSVQNLPVSRYAGHIKPSGNPRSSTLYKNSTFPSIFRYMEDERWTGKFSIIPFYVDICPKARIQGFPIDSENWFDVGKPETLAKAEAYYASL